MKAEVSNQLTNELAKIQQAIPEDVAYELEQVAKYKLKSIYDEEGMKLLKTGQKYARQWRKTIEDMRVKMGRDALNYKRAVDNTAKKIQQSLIGPAELNCKNQIEAAQKAVAEIEERERNEKLIEACLDDAYEMNAEVDRKAEEAKRLEAQRIAQEEKEKELKEREAKLAQAEREKQIALEAEAKAKREAEERAAEKIRAAKLAAENAKREAAEAEKRAQEKADREAREREQKRIAEENAKREAEQKAAAEKARLEKLAPDMEKARIYIKKLVNIEVPEIQEATIKQHLTQVKSLIDKVASAYQVK